MSSMTKRWVFVDCSGCISDSELYDTEQEALQRAQSDLAAEQKWTDEEGEWGVEPSFLVAEIKYHTVKKEETVDGEEYLDFEIEPVNSDPGFAPNPWIVCAAMKHPTNERIIAGSRHYDNIMRGQIEAAEGFESWRNCEQGFIDQLGNFLSRKEARKIAEKNGQIRRRCGGDDAALFSENLY